MRPRHQPVARPSESKRPVHERAASVVEYALLMALLMVGLMLALEGFSSQAGNDLEQRGSHVGNPQGLTPTS